jgi:hypothetical protein
MQSPLWKVIDGFPDYEVSQTGEVRSWRSHPQQPNKPLPVLMTGFVSALGYRSVFLRKEGDIKPYRRLVHRLVAISFIPNPKTLSDVAHNDGNPRNNCVGNLRWSTHQDNQLDMRRHGTMQDGQKSCTCKLSPEVVLEIRGRVRAGGTQRKLAVEYGISTAQLSRIVNGHRWKSITQHGP